MTKELLWLLVFLSLLAVPKRDYFAECRCIEKAPETNTR